MTAQARLTTTEVSEDGELDDDFLRRTLTTRSADPAAPSTPEWEAVGAYVLVLADRHARQWPTDPVEFTDGFISAVLEALHRNPAEFLRAQHPWGLLVTKGRGAGQTAVGTAATGGLVDRDPLTHHVRLSKVPAVACYDDLAEIDLTIARRIG